MGLLHCMIIVCMCARLRCAYTFLRGSLIFNSHLLHNWVSEWIFSTLMEAASLEDQLLPGSRDEITARPAASDRLCGPTRCSQDPLVLWLPCPLELVGFLCCCCCCCWQLGWSWEGRARESEERQKQKWGFEARMEIERERMEDASLHGGHYLSQPLIERNVSWKSCTQHFTYFLHCCFWCIICSLGTATCIQSHTCTLLQLWNEEVHAKPTPRFHNAPWGGCAHFSGVFD